MPPRGLDLGLLALGALGVDLGDLDLGAVLGEQPRDRAADAVTTAGDDGDLAVEEALQSSIAGTSVGSWAMAGNLARLSTFEPMADVYWDPFDTEIDTDPYDTWRRMRDEAPLYRNDRYDFWALSRFADVEAAHRDPRTFSSRHGTVLELMGAAPDRHAAR